MGTGATLFEIVPDPIKHNKRVAFPLVCDKIREIEGSLLLDWMLKVTPVVLSNSC